MIFLYNIIIHISYFFLKIIAFFNPKIKLFINGRKETFKKLNVITPTDKVFWIHAASLGEFEQARPIIERLKKEYTTHKIVVSFFSPSGYEIRKNYELADVVCYLPFDTKKKIKRFIHQIHPDISIIIKYEFWPNLLNELKKANIKTVLVSGIFREDQLFFKSYGKWMRGFLNTFTHFFVQNTTSKNLLNSINFKNNTLSGDTRFDRVYEILKQDNTLDFVNEFKDNNYTVVAGSTWKEDEDLLVNYINTEISNKGKIIIAPHNINTVKIEELRNAILKKTILYSERNSVNLKEYQVLIIDTIGILTKIYSYANAAYVGGGLATGLHNILEPATYGIPIVFGTNKHEKFKEAVDLINLGGSKGILNQEEFSGIFTDLKNNLELRINMGEINKNYVKNNIGATELVLSYIHKII